VAYFMSRRSVLRFLNYKFTSFIISIAAEFQSQMQIKQNIVHDTESAQNKQIIASLVCKKCISRFVLVFNEFLILTCAARQDASTA